MPRGRNPNIEEAEKLYREGKKLIEIANILNVPDGTVRRWKKTYNWDNERSDKNSERSIKKNVKKVKKKDPVSRAVEEVMENEELTDKQKLFCIYYSKCFNATKAYLKAYECDYIAANVNGSRLLVKDSIKAMIDQLTQVTINKEVLKRSLLQKYIDIAFSDIKEYMEFGTETIEGKNGDFELSVVKLKDSNGVDGTLISEVSQGKDGIKIKMLDKMKAMDFLSKHTNLLSDEEKTKLDIEYKTLQNEKLKAEINKLTGNNQEIEDTTDIEGEIYG